MSSITKKRGISAAAAIVIIIILVIAISAGIYLYMSQKPPEVPPEEKPPVEKPPEEKPPAEKPPEEKPVSLRFVTTPAGSTWNAYAGGIADIIKRYLPPGSSIDVLPTGAAVSNPIQVNKGEADLGLTFHLVANMAAKGIGPYEETGKLENIRALVSHLDTYWIGVTWSKKIGLKDLYELKEKKYPIRMVIFAKGGLGELGGRLILNEYGITYEDIESWGGKVIFTSQIAQMADLAKAGQVDMIVNMMSPRHPMFTRVFEENDWMIVPLHEEVMNSLAEKYGFFPTKIPAGSFRGVDEDVPAVGTFTILICNKDLDDKIAYVIAKALAENKEELGTIHAALKAYSPEKAARDAGIPLHPGAEAYYKEQGLLEEKPAAPTLKEPVKLGFSVGPTGQTSYIRGAAMADVIVKNLPEGSSVDLVVGGGYLTFPVRVSKGEADFAITSSAALIWAYEGTGPFEEKLSNLRAITTKLERSYWVFVVLADVPINSLEEVKEKQYPLKLTTLQVGAAGEYIAREVLGVHGITYDDIKAWGGTVTHASWKEIASLLKDGVANSFMGVVPPKHPRLTDVATSRAVKFIPLSDAAIKRLTEIGAYVKDYLPANSYPGQDKDVPTVADDLVLFCRADLPDAVVYTVTKAICENKEALVAARPPMEGWDPATGWKTPIPLHPGAELYYKLRGWIE
jgi:hypothetical protein